MKVFPGWSSALLLGLMTVQAQETNQVQDWDSRLRNLETRFEKQQRDLRESFEKMIREQQQQIDLLKAQLAATASNSPVSAGPMTASAPLEPASTAGVAWSPSAPIRVGGGSTYADIGLVATFAAGTSTARDIEGGTQLGGHDPNQRGFSVQGVELNLQGAVDPYFRGNANIVFQLDAAGESFVELEEAWLETMSMPWHLQVRAGQMLTDFGRVNTQHPHSWGFVDEPLVNGRFLGPDGLRGPGARVSWLAPTPFYSEIFLALQNSQGETAYSFRNDNEDEPFLGRPVEQGKVTSFGDLLFTPRYAASFDLTEQQTLLVGTSAALGPNGSGSDTDTQIYGVDAYWKWKPANAHAGFPFVSWQTEAMLRRYLAGAFGGDPGADPVVLAVPREMLTDWGMYSQVLWGFRPGWVAGLRGDYVTRGSRADYERLNGDDPSRLPRWRLSPNLTWYPSEFSKLRLQYNYDDRDRVGVDHSIWLQWELLLGAHAAHKF